MLRTAISALMLLSGLIAAPASVRAAESYDNCTGFIDSVPTTITTQGTWCLRQDLSTAITAGPVITIATNNVTIDCNDFKLGGLAAGPGTDARGIIAFDRFNATVRHCHIRGFRYGVLFTGPTGGHVVEDNRFDGNTYTGLVVGGDGSVVRRNLVRDTGGSTVAGFVGLAIGITTVSAVDVLDNTVSGVLPSANGGNGTAYGIYTDFNPNGRISGNRIRGLVGFGLGTAYGIYNSGSGRISLDRNYVVGDGSLVTIGLRCHDGNGRAIDNIVNGFTVPISLCRSEGNSL